MTCRGEVIVARRGGGGECHAPGRCGAPGRGEVEGALGVGGGDTDQAGVAFTGRRGGDVDGGGSLGRVGKDCVTGLLLSSDMGEVEARGGNIPPQARAEAHSIWPRRR